MKKPQTPSTTYKPKHTVVWENGVPRASVEKPHFNKANASHLLAELQSIELNFPYEGEDERYFGKTKGEAIASMVIDKAASGDWAALKEVLDRVMGKPQQNIKSVSIKGSIGDFLDTLDTSEEDVIDI